MLLNFSLLIKISFVTHLVLLLLPLAKCFLNLPAMTIKSGNIYFFIYQYFRNQNTNITAAGPKKRYTAC